MVESLRLKEDAVYFLDRELDSGLGACWLRNPEIAVTVEQSLLHFDNDRYRLLAWCLMPNHVHVVIEMLQGAVLGDIVGSWKSYTGRRANQKVGRFGPFWHADYFDRYMRDEDHLQRTIGYVENNPVKAGLVKEPENWVWSSARHRMSVR